MGVASITVAGRVLLVLLATAGTYLGSPSRIAMAKPARIDWQRGLLIAQCAAAGDVRSPSRQLARVKATRHAKARCQSAIIEALASLPLAQGLSLEREGEAKLADLSIDLLLLSADTGTDGSVVLEMALPLEAVRSWASGASAPLPTLTDLARDVIIVDARHLNVKPVLGLTLADGKHSYVGPTLYFTDEKAARVRAGSEARWLKGRKGGDKKLPIVLLVDKLEALASRPLIVVLWTGT